MHLTQVWMQSKGRVLVEECPSPGLHLEMSVKPLAVRLELGGAHLHSGTAPILMLVLRAPMNALLNALLRVALQSLSDPHIDLKKVEAKRTQRPARIAGGAPRWRRRWRQRRQWWWMWKR